MTIDNLIVYNTKVYNSICLFCKIPFYCKPANKKLGWGKYCSLLCKNNAAKTGKLFTCVSCKKETWKTPAQIKRSKTGNVYCSRHCSTVNNNKLFKKWENHPRYSFGRNIYRKNAIDVYGLKCNKNENCPLINIKIPEYMFEVDHINSNRDDNTIDNLQVLCLYCHREKTFNSFQKSLCVVQ